MLDFVEELKERFKCGCAVDRALIIDMVERELMAHEVLPESFELSQFAAPSEES